MRLDASLTRHRADFCPSNQLQCNTWECQTNPSVLRQPQGMYKRTLRRRQMRRRRRPNGSFFSTGALYRRDEILDFCGVFASGGRFDAARDVHGVRACLPDGFLDVVGGQTTGEDDRFSQTAGLDRKGPVKARTGAPILPGDGRVQQPRRCRTRAIPLESDDRGRGRF